MNEDVKDVSEWFGYKKDISHTGRKTAGDEVDNEDKEWDEVENLSLEEKTLLMKIQKVI
jgi:hypothetical protein